MTPEAQRITVVWRSAFDWRKAHAVPPGDDWCYALCGVVPFMGWDMTETSDMEKCKICAEGAARRTDDNAGANQETSSKERAAR